MRGATLCSLPYYSKSYPPLVREITSQSILSVFIVPFVMALSMHEPPISWNRVLPKPAALIHAQFTDPFARRDTPPAHTLGSEAEAANASGGDSGRRSTVPSVAYYELSRPSSLTWHRHSNST